MKYQLVVQFDARTLQDFDGLLQLEESIEGEIGELGIVDGHDFGSEQFNIFVLTDAPQIAFERILKVANNLAVTEGMCAAYRKMDNEDFTILWPGGLSEFVVT